ncbi:hypothetical protein EUX98_g8360 [Antrodiella citrinella]|uniref:OBG-type G domain-containing protein n=1 Tax=Antrodiella citrinella TaxID=2447956 RepID=A0A4S4MAL2_9APHY|nr:hypothetical protein EUX98_g8360 [Antrodiella citrinella]
MPPKKVVQEKKVLLGRPGNNLKIGIVGVPNVGKSSFFNVLSKTDLGIARNYPYATINPEEARIPVPDERFDWLCATYKPSSRVPAALTTIDIAGLTAGASTGAGLGNAFLSHVRAVDGIFQVVRAFDDAEVIHVEGEVNPLRDMEIIQTELRLKDIEWVEKHLENVKKTSRALGSNSLADRAKKEEIATIEKVLKVLTVDNLDVRKADWGNKEASTSLNARVSSLFCAISYDDKERYAQFITQLVEIEVVNSLQLLTAKPVTYLINLSEKDYVRKKNKWRILLAKIKAWIDENNPGDPLIPFSVALEERLVGMSEEEQIEEQKRVGAQSALPKITHAGYACLDASSTVFTVTQYDAYRVLYSSFAISLADLANSDFENKFVCGEIMSYEDLREHGSETAVKAAGKLRQQGKPYEMVDGDIAYWKSGA